MNAKKFYTVLVCVMCTCMSSSVFANDAFRERTDSWLQTDNNMRTGNWLQTENWLQSASNGRPTIGEGDDPIPDPTVPVTPLENGVPVLLGLGLAYGFYVLRRSRKRC